MGIITCTKNVGLSRMNGKSSNIILMCVPLMLFFHCIIIVYSHLHIIRSRNKPLLTCNKLGGSYWKICYFKRFSHILKKKKKKKKLKFILLKLDKKMNYIYLFIYLFIYL